jgi:hypothetical protein
MPVIKALIDGDLARTDCLRPVTLQKAFRGS